MGYYKKHIKRLRQAAKLLNQKRNTLREMREEGLTLITFHTTTRTLTLPYDQEAAEPAASGYHEALSNQRKALKNEAHREWEQWAKCREMQQRDSQFLTDAKLAQAHGRAGGGYPNAGK